MNKKSFLMFIISIFFTGIIFQFSATDSYAQGRNSVSGFVFDTSRRPVGDAYVELLNEYYSTIRRTRTNGSGLYSFRGLGEGRYKVRVLSYSTNYQEQTQSVSLISVSAIRGSGAVSEQLDFYLSLNRRKIGPFYAPGVIFVQEIPKSAEKLYEDGINLLDDDKDKEGFEKLKSALEIFPDYYLALDRLGTEYVVREYYRPAYVLLSKALEINPKSYSSMFGLGLTEFHLKHVDDSIKTFKKSLQLYDESVDAYLWLGIVLHSQGKLTEAEEYLNKASKLNNKSSDVHWQLARLYIAQKKFSEAADELELYLKYKKDLTNEAEIKQSIAKLRQKVAK